MVGVENSARVADQISPARQGLIPQRPRRRERPTPQIVEHRLVRRDDGGKGGKLGGHVAQGQAPLYVEGAHGLPGKLHGMARGAARPKARDHGQSEILRRHARTQPTLHGYPHGARAAHAQGSGGESVFGFGGPDAPGQSRHRPLCAGMTVGADEREPWPDDAQLRRDHMHDPLGGVAQVEEPDAGRGGGVSRGRNKRFAAGHDGLVRATGTGVDHVIHGRKSHGGVEDRPPAFGEAAKSDATGALVQENTINGDQIGGFAQGGDPVAAPDLLEQG